MSRVGQSPIALPKGVDVRIEGQNIEVKGSNGSLVLRAHSEVSLALEEGRVNVKPRSQSKLARALWGTTRSLINSMVQGVSQGFTKELELVGVGYRAQVQGKNLQLQLGLSHDVLFPIPEGIDIKCEKPTSIRISGADKQLVGETAARIRKYRPPEPYKGKGIKFAGEMIRRKQTKK